MEKSININEMPDEEETVESELQGVTGAEACSDPAAVAAQQPRQEP